jgi:hypothetical protein
VRRTLVLVTAGLLAFSLAAPVAVMAAPGFTVQVAKPNHVDDTATVQAALNSCVAHGPNCTVRLQAGTYRTSQLVTGNFRGTFEGAGQNRTTIQALPNLSVTWPDPLNGQCLPNLTDCRWPNFIIFVDGNVEVSDLSLDFPYTNGQETTPYMYQGETASGVDYALDFLGDRAVGASVDRVSIKGREDHSSTSLYGCGFNLNAGIFFDGYLPTPPYLVPGGNQTYATLSGSFAVRGSSVRTMCTGIQVGGQIKSSRFTVTGNRIDDVGFSGIYVSGGDSSVFEIAYNHDFADNIGPAETSHFGLYVEPGPFTGSSTRLSRFSIHDNNIVVNDACGCGMWGIWLLDAVGGLPYWFTATVIDNRISLPATYMLPGEGKAGIDINNIKGAVISGNTITEAATGTYEGIGVWGNVDGWPMATGNVIVGNDVSGVALDPTPGFALAQIFLDSYTSKNLVGCLRHTDNVLDLGTNNTVIGCDPPTTTAKAATGAPSAIGKHGLKTKTSLP